MPICKCENEGRWVMDGYGIPLAVVCDSCEGEVMALFRSDIMEKYECDQEIEPEEFLWSPRHEDPRTPRLGDEDAVKQIVDAFAEVSLGDGVSLREADVIDDYGTDDERAAARKQDELQDWQRIPDEDIENHSSVLCFMDDEGLRFHLPAYMRFTLRRYHESESMSTDSTLYQLCDPDCIKRLLACLTGQQIDAIKTFLNTCLAIGDDWLDISNLPLALRQWQGDEAAAEELQAVQAAQIAAAKQLAGHFSGLDPELLKKCQSGDLTEEQQQQVLGLIRDATGKCGPAGDHRKPRSGPEPLSG